MNISGLIMDIDVNECKRIVSLNNLHTKKMLIIFHMLSYILPIHTLAEIMIENMILVIIVKWWNHVFENAISQL